MIYWLSIIVKLVADALSLVYPKDPYFITEIESSVFKRKVTLCCGDLGAHNVGAHDGPVSPKF